MPLLDMNMNMNMSFPASGGGGRSLRPRYNSDIESRLVDVSQPGLLVPPPLPGSPAHYPPFHEFWDADLRAYMYLDQFIAHLITTDAAVAAQAAAAVAANSAAAAVAAAAAAAGAGATWHTTYGTVARNGGTNIPPSEMSQAQLGSDVLGILDLGLEREDRFEEIVDQDDADGAINYWLGMLKIDPARHPATNLMVHTGRRIGEYVAMCLKSDFQCPRPSQVCPAITPMIDPPVTPSFPAGHAVQSYLISYLLAYSLSDANGNTHLPQHQLPPAGSSIATFLAPGTCPTCPLFDLAKRVSENRVVAGLHFDSDIRAGRAVATQIFRDIRAIATIWGTPNAPLANTLRGQVRAEFPQYAI
jgi:membrane-associated phospholipid phosphatase